MDTKLQLLENGIWVLHQQALIFKVFINLGGQGTYFKPQFCVNGTDTIIDNKRHSTRAMGGMFRLVSKSRHPKPFMLLYQFKAPHRDWRPDLCIMELFEDFEHCQRHLMMIIMEDTASQNMIKIGRHLNKRYETNTTSRPFEGFNALASLWRQKLILVTK